MASMTDPKELFLHELKDIYYVEKSLTKVLPKLAGEATDEELTKGFEDHLKETEAQIGNLEQVFEALGEKPQAEPCPGFDGLKAEHDEFVEEEEPSAEILDVFLTGAGARTEHYEIAAYSGLIAQARALGEKDAVELLEENLRQEKEALKLMESLGKRLAKETAGAAA